MPSLGKFGFKTKKVIGGKEHEHEIEEGQLLDTFSFSECGASFKNEQGLGKHEASRAEVQVQKR